MVVKRKSRRKIRKSRTGVSKRNSKRRVSKKKNSYRRRSRKKSKQKKSVRSRSKKKLKGVSRVRRSKGSKPVPFAMRGGAKYIDDTININKDKLAKLIKDAPEDCQKSITLIINEAEERTVEVLEAMNTDDAQALLVGRDKRNINTDTLTHLIASRWGANTTCEESMTLIIEKLAPSFRILMAQQRHEQAEDVVVEPPLAITVPPGVGPGRLIQFINPYNQAQTLQVQVPAGHYAGAVFHVQI